MIENSIKFTKSEKYVLMAGMLKGKIDIPSYVAIGGNINKIEKLELMRKDIRTRDDLENYLSVVGWNVKYRRISSTVPLIIPTLPPITLVIPSVMVTHESESYIASGDEVILYHVVDAITIEDPYEGTKLIPSNMTLIWNHTTDIMRNWKLYCKTRIVIIKASKISIVSLVHSSDIVMPPYVVSSKFSYNIQDSRLIKIGNGVLSTNPFDVEIDGSLKLSWNEISLEDTVMKWTLPSLGENEIYNTIYLNDLLELMKNDWLCTVIEKMQFDDKINISRNYIYNLDKKQRDKLYELIVGKRDISNVECLKSYLISYHKLRSH